MAPRTSRKSPALLVRADGSLEPLHLNPGLFQPTLVVLARERCLFERLDIAPGMKSAAAVAAARLHADSGSPYQRSASLITRKGSSFGIWWWDAQWVADTLAGTGVDSNIRVLPEPMARAAADGWRIVKASTGYEAQLWKGGFLVADAWRRRPYDDDAWRGFVRVQPDRAGAGDEALMAQDPPFTLQNPYRNTQLSDWTPERSMQAAMVGLGVVLVCSATWLLGETYALNASAKLAETQAANIRARRPAAAGNIQSQVSGLVALRSAVSGPDPMVMLQDTQTIIQPFGHKLIAFTAERSKIRVVMGRDAAADLAAMSRQLLASPYFSAVKPQLDTKRNRLILDLIPKGAKPAPAKAT